MFWHYHHNVLQHMQHHRHHQVVDCGKEGLHSTALPLSLPLPINTNTSKEEELTKLDHLDNKKKSSTIEEEELELTRMVSKTKAPMETSWSLSLSPWRVKFLVFTFNLGKLLSIWIIGFVIASSWQDSEGNCQTSPVVIGLNLRSVSEINFDEDFKVIITSIFKKLILWNFLLAFLNFLHFYLIPQRLWCTVGSAFGMRRKAAGGWRGRSRSYALLMFMWYWGALGLYTLLLSS